MFNKWKNNFKLILNNVNIKETNQNNFDLFDKNKID